MPNETTPIPVPPGWISKESDPEAWNRSIEWLHFGPHVLKGVVSILKSLLTKTRLGRLLTRYDILITPTEVAFINREKNGEDLVVRFEDVPANERWQEVFPKYKKPETWRGWRRRR